MTSGQITVELRARLRVEANDRCGYCQTQQVLAYGSFVEALLSLARAGETEKARERLQAIVRTPNSDETKKL